MVERSVLDLADVTPALQPSNASSDTVSDLLKNQTPIRRHREGGSWSLGTKVMLMIGVTNSLWFFFSL